MTGVQKVTFQQSQSRFAHRKVNDGIQLLGKALPATVVQAVGDGGGIYLVEFAVDAAPFTLPRITVPLFGPEWIRYPIQPGTKGAVFPVDARMGGMSGLGSGTANLVGPANLSALVFFPVGNALWTPTDDANKTVIYGPTGAILRNLAGDVSVTVDETAVTIIGKDTITLKIDDDNSITITSSGITIKGDLKINDAEYLDHKHSDVQSGSDETGEVVT